MVEAPELDSDSESDSESEEEEDEDEDVSLFLDFFLDFLDLFLELLRRPSSELSELELWLLFFFLPLFLLLLRRRLLQLLVLRDDGLKQSIADAECRRPPVERTPSPFTLLLSSAFPSSPSESSKLVRLNLIGLKLSTSLMAFSKSGSR